MNYVTYCLTAKSTWDDLILYHEGPSDVKESRAIDLKLCYNTFKFKEGESLAQTFTRYKALMNELVNDGIKLLKIEINTGFINGLSKLWLAFCQCLRNTNHVKEYELASLFGKLKYEENFIDNIYKTEKTLVSATPLPSYLPLLSRTFKIVLMMKRIQEAYEEEVSSDENEATKVKALMALANEERVFVSKESVSKGEWVMISIQKQAKLDLLNMQHVNTKILKENQNLRNELKELTSITETWLNNSNKVNQCISEPIPTQKKKILGMDQFNKDTSSSGLKDLVFVKSLADNSEVSITGSSKPKLSKVEDFNLTNHDTNKHPLPLLEKLAGAKPIHGAKTIKSILKSNPTFKAESLKGITLKEPSSAPAKDNKKGSSASKTSSAPTCKLKNVKVKDDRPLAIVMKELNKLKLHLNKKSHLISKTVSLNRYELCRSYDHDTYGHHRIISLRREIKPRDPQHVTKNCEICGSNVHTTYDHNDIEWFRKREALQDKSFKANLTFNSQLVSVQDIKQILRNPTFLLSREFLGTQKEKHLMCLSVASWQTFMLKSSKLKPFTKSSNMYKEYLVEFWYSAKAFENSKVSFLIPTSGIYGEVEVTTFRNAIGAHYLFHSSEYVAPPSLDVVSHWFPTIGYGKEVSAKGTLMKSLFPPR
uniref:Retrovirus-related Pol polyprotein from transposon TNT 1-94 n=1 Tax=Tanacetum cinerariifolium TaxID=118510 RepID=A0A6L2L7B9_TANCI|nr:hypothetical protein [Tanacetum cinerariifolium]